MNSGEIFMLKNKKKNSESKDEFYTKLGILTKEVTVGQVLDKFQETFEQILSHFNVRRIQQREFLKDLQNPDNHITQIDFAQA